MRKVYLKKTLVGLLSAVLAVTMVPGNVFSRGTSVSAADNDGYSLVWEDNFDGDGLNTEDWNVETHEPGWVNQELQRYTSLDEGNIEVKDGKLLIKPHYEAGTSDNANLQAEDTRISFDFTVWNEVTEDIALQINMGHLDSVDDAPTPTKIVIKEVSLKEILSTTSSPSNDDADELTGAAAEEEEKDDTDAADEEATDDETSSDETDAADDTAPAVDDKDDAQGDAKPALDDNAGSAAANDDAEPETDAEPEADTEDAETVTVTQDFAGAEGDDNTSSGTMAEFYSDEMLYNTNFNGGDGWYCGFNETGEGSCEYNGQAEITITNAGDANWHIQLNQSGLHLEQGHKYRFTMTASSNVDKYTEINFMGGAPSYKWYGGGEKPLLIKGVQASGGSGKSEITSGRITTQGKHDFTYGPSGKGFLPAFWLMATDEGLYGQWPKCGEIDIMEVMGQDTSKSYHTIHYGYSSGTGHKENQGFKTLTDNSFSDDYHIFTVDWEPGKITWYVDGTEVYSTNDWYTGTDDDNQITYPAPFDQNFYIILNLAVGGSWVGYPDEADYETMNSKAYEIDYVKVYQKSAEEYAREENEVKKPEKSAVTFREADSTGNYVINGNFAEDIALDGAAGADPNNWKLHLESDAKGTTYEVKDNSITINPSAVGSQNHSVQLKQENIPMYKGWEYELTFDAVSTEDRNIVIDVEGPDRGWTRYMQDTTVAVSTTKQSYTYSFTMEQKTDANGSLEFNLGNQGSTAPVTISNVRLTHKSGDEIPEDKSKTIRPDGNYIYNGSFDQGEKRLGYWEFSEEDAENITVTNFGNVRELKVTVPEGKTVTVKQSQLSPLGVGAYELSFDARTKGGAADGVKFNVSGTVYTPELTAENGKFSKKLSIEEGKTRDESFLEMTFTKAGTYYVDNVFLGEAALIKNGSFNAGLTAYDPYLNAGASATYVVDSMNGNDNTFAMNIKDTGDTDWYVQLNQDGVTLENGKKYFFSLRMRSDMNRKVSYMLQQNGGEWSNYSGTGIVELTSEWQTFENTFTMAYPTDTATRFNVTMGAVGGERITEDHNVYVDDIVLYEVSDEQGGENIDPTPEDPTPETPSPETPTPGQDDEPNKPSKPNKPGHGGGNSGSGNSGSGSSSSDSGSGSTGTTNTGNSAATKTDDSAKAQDQNLVAKTDLPEVLGAGKEIGKTSGKNSGKSTGSTSATTTTTTTDNSAVTTEPETTTEVEAPAAETVETKEDPVVLTDEDTAKSDTVETPAQPEVQEPAPKKGIFKAIIEFIVNLFKAFINLFK